MGKAQKQANNRFKQQIERLKKDKDFIEMIEAMEPNKMYNLKRGDKDLFNGKQFTGTQWKATFLEPKPAENDTTGN